jgi:hypothetical protein
MNEIRLFMPDYQHNFWISARHAAEALDKELRVELFLSGFCASGPDLADRGAGVQ